MARVVGIGKQSFEKIIKEKCFYVDKTAFIKEWWDNKDDVTLITRPRRFGKSIAANMLSAYYTCEYDSRELFSNLKIASSDSYEKHLNKYDVIFLNMQEFLSQSSNVEEMLSLLKKSVIWDLLDKYPDFRYFDETNLMRTLQDIYNKTKRPFVVIIDEWDCIFREYITDKKAQEKYLDFLRDLLKDKGYVGLAYMTGILPIKKYGTHSALNMFDEFSMIDPGPLAEYVGFTEEEVSELCERYGMDMQELKSWYDGYSFEGAPSIYSPRSVVSCMRFGKFGNYWNQTETFEALKMYIDMNFEGLRDDVLSMIAGESVPVNTGSFTNDMATFHTEDDVLTLLIHLGYLAYDYDNKTVKIPNNEVRAEYVSSVVELKWNESANGAIEQIKKKEYCKSLEEYKGNILLVGVNYNKKTKKHECIIEEDIK